VQAPKHVVLNFRTFWQATPSLQLLRSQNVNGRESRDQFLEALGMCSGF